MRKNVLVPFLLVLLFASFAADARTTRIMSEQLRKDYIAKLEAIVDYKDADLEHDIPYVVNPFFFEQPLLLKLRAPGGVTDRDVLESFSRIIVTEVSGAFVRLSKRSLLMKSGDLLKEGDQVVRELPDLGGMAATVTIGTIEQDKFVLKLNDAMTIVDLTEG